MGVKGVKIVQAYFRHESTISRWSVGFTKSMIDYEKKSGRFPTLLYNA